VKSLTTLQNQGTVYFPIVFHMHQPVGNFPWVFEDAYQKSYLPLLKTIQKYPRIRINLHITGPLLNWLKEHHSDYLDHISSLSSKNQLEIVGGGFYEPVLAVIPEADRLRQIEKTIEWWKEQYEITPRGLWLAERVWVPDLPRTLDKLNIEFVFIDDYLLHMAGFSEKETFYAYKTEYQGRSTTIFPINESIRYLVPWKPPSETIHYLSKARDPYHEKIVVMISDAEKMGVWPAGDRTTHDICYISGYDGKKGWMDSFFESLLHQDWIKPVLISTYLKKHDPRGLIYLPTSSYDKMAIWALPTTLRKRLEHLRKKAEEGEVSYAEDVLTFSKGSLWQNFMVKYSQANVMHKRMLYCRNKLRRIESAIPLANREEILDHILSSQSNDAYWSGMFGGVYYRFLRHTCLKHIIKAEFLIDRVCKNAKIDLPNVLIQDVLLDGQKDGILENNKISCFISSLKGGSIFSLNFKKRGYDYLNVLRRIIEAYHTGDVPAVEDSIEKWTFQDHFFHTIKDVETYQTNQYVDIGDFANQKYNIEQDLEGGIVLSRSAVVKDSTRRITPVSIEKNFKIQDSSIIVNYEIIFPDRNFDTNLYFSPELNFLGASYPYKTHGYINHKKFNLKELVSEEKSELITIQDLNELEQVELKVIFSDPIHCIVFPIFSYAKSENGYEEQYQGTSIFPFFEITEERATLQIKLTMTHHA
jgi:hypothetical protein